MQGVYGERAGGRRRREAVGLLQGVGGRRTGEDESQTAGKMVWPSLRLMLRPMSPTGGVPHHPSPASRLLLPAAEEKSDHMPLRKHVPFSMGHLTRKSPLLLLKPQH